MSVRAAVSHRGRLRPLANNDVVHTGDAVRLDVQLEQSAEVVVLAIDGAGKPTLLFPGADATIRLDSGMRVPLPAEFVLDDRIGVETLVLIASTRPLTQSTPALHALVHAVRDAPQAPPRRRPFQPRGGTTPPPAPQPHDPATTARVDPDTTLLVETAGDVLLAPRTRELGEALRAAPTRGFTTRPRPDSPDRVGADDEGVVLWRLSLRHVP